MAQIKIQDLLPLLNPGWVAMDKYGEWHWFPNAPTVRQGRFLDCWWADRNILKVVFLSNCLNIQKFDGDWKDSLMECGK